jgi:copper(I)-binding protein
LVPPSLTKCRGVACIDAASREVDEDMMKTAYAAALAAMSGILGTPIIPMPAFAYEGFVHIGLAAFRDPSLVAAEVLAGAEYTLGSLRIKAPWMRATPKGASVAGGYLTITNTGNEPDRLMSVASEIAATVAVHEMSVSGGVMTMRPVEQPLEIKPGATLALKPGGYHVMFTQLKLGVKEGDKVKATLVFEKAGKIEIEFLAGGLAATGPAGGSPDQKM